MKVYTAAAGDQNNRHIFTERETGHNASVVTAAKEAPSDLLVLKVDACGLQCPGPIVKLKMETEKLKPGKPLLQTAIDNGLKIIACQMSMNVMGAKREELIDETEVGGVANYLESSS